VSAPRLSRRALFGAGLSRALQARVVVRDAPIAQAIDELAAPAPGEHARHVLGRHTALLAGGEVELRAAYATVFARRP